MVICSFLLWKFLIVFIDQLHAEATYIAIILSFEKYNELDKTRFYSLIEEELYPQLLDRLGKVKYR